MKDELSRQEILQGYADEAISDYFNDPEFAYLCKKNGPSLKKRLEHVPSNANKQVVEFHCRNFRVKLPNYSKYECGDPPVIKDLRGYIFEEIREQIIVRTCKKKAEELGIAYWPALRIILNSKNQLTQQYGSIEAAVSRLEELRTLVKKPEVVYPEYHDDQMAPDEMADYKADYNAQFARWREQYYYKQEYEQLESNLVVATLPFQVIAITEKILQKQGRVPWEPTVKGKTDNGTREHGGWDSAGCWGLSVGNVAEVWAAGGFHDGIKFRLLISRLDSNRDKKGHVGNIGIRLGSHLAQERDNRFVYILRAASWITRHQGHLKLTTDDFSLSALIFLGRLKPIQRAAALEGVSHVHDSVRLKVENLNLENLKKLQGSLKALVEIKQDEITVLGEGEKYIDRNGKLYVLKPVGLRDALSNPTQTLLRDDRMPLQEQAIRFASPRLSWQVLLRQEPPKGLEKFHAYGLSGKFFNELLKQAKKEGAAKDAAVIPCYNLAVLFGNKTALNQYRKKVDPDNKKNIHDLGQFVLPKSGYWSIEKWRGFVMCFPEALEQAGTFSRIEQSLQRIPKSLKEFREAAAKFVYENIGEHATLALLCHQKGVDQKTFEQYKALMEQGKNAESIPHIRLTGEEIGLAGGKDWAFRKLPCNDPQGPLLGLYTGCCQHLEGAAASCARHGVTSPYSGFYVVEYKGEVVAQSWAWRGTKGELVFDSIEMRGGDYQYGSSQELYNACAKLYSEAAKRLKGRLCVTRVLVGAYGGINPEIPLSRTNTPAEMKAGGRLYSDAGSQWVLAE